MGSKGSETHRGTSVFGGDVVISGTLHGGSPLKISGGVQLTGSIDVLNGFERGLVINEDGAAFDFRVESQGEDEAILVDGDANVLYINKGETAFTTIVANTNDEAIRVDASGVIFNEDGNAANDFRVESNTKSHAIFVDAGIDRVYVLSASAGTPLDISTSYVSIMSPGETSAAMPDTSFFVSGAIGKRGTSERTISTFGGDVTVSGSLHTLGDLHVTNNLQITNDAHFADAIYVSGNVNVAEYIYHGGDSNTYIRLTIDEMNFQAGGVNFLTFEEDSTNTIYFNQGAADVDFKVSAVENTEIFNIDAALERVRVDGTEDGSSSANLFEVNNSLGGMIHVAQGAGVVFNEGGHASADFRVESDARTHAIFVDAGTNQVFVLSGSTSDNTSTPESAYTDLALFVSGAIGKRGTSEKGTAVFGGDLVVSGTSYHLAGLTGSLTTLTDGTSYIKAGSNVTITTSSLGQIIIAAAAGGGGGSGTGVGFIAAANEIISTTGSIYVGTANDSNPDINLGKDGSAVFNEQGASVDFRVESNTKTHAIFVDGSADRVHFISGSTSSALEVRANQVIVLSGGAGASFPEAGQPDVNFYVSGSVGTRGTSERGTSVFGGDLVVSGNLHSLQVANFPAGMSGSITQLIDGSSYIKAGTNITVSSASNGTITIAGPAAAIDGSGATTRLAFWSDGDTLTSDADLTYADDTLTVNKAAIFNESGGNNDFRIESANKSHALFVDANTNQVLILSGGSGTSLNEASFGDVNFFVSGTMGSHSTSVRGTSLFGGDVAISGSVYAGSTLSIGGHVTPTLDRAYDLGAVDRRFANIYTGDLHLKNDRGDWTIVEEEEYLTIYNNKSNKRYKFVLEEI